MWLLFDVPSVDLCYHWEYHSRRCREWLFYLGFSGINGKNLLQLFENKKVSNSFNVLDLSPGRRFYII